MARPRGARARWKGEQNRLPRERAIPRVVESRSRLRQAQTDNAGCTPTLGTTGLATHLGPPRADPNFAAFYSSVSYEGLGTVVDCQLGLAPSGERCHHRQLSGVGTRRDLIRPAALACSGLAPGALRGAWRARVGQKGGRRRGGRARRNQRRRRTASRGGAGVTAVYAARPSGTTNCSTVTPVALVSMKVACA